ncbi:hypothetical protein EKO04_010545 [Ascochyta lentis]|uniref:Xylanolytic transcriptional activator regulatory domain-containing protein n=1 Tax=Ascochyta lentis TaxID=205686 RepID=A0A8H7ISY1_9PLEO|nr:hypothetical protein EKO04_010545 [Ascochyta lentis]
MQDKLELAPEEEDKLTRIWETAASVEDVQTDPEASSRSEATTNAPTPTETAITHIPSEDRQDLDSRYASFVQRQDNARSNNRTFWNQLDESVGHAESASPDNSTEQSKAGSAVPSQPDTSPDFIFGNTFKNQQENLSDISEKERATLVPVFFARVHPICRILHEPTALAFVQGIEELTHASTHRLKFNSLRAIDCAIAFAAVKTLTPGECYSKLGAEKRVVEARLRHILESALAACDILNSKEIVTLQAFTLYIMFMCSTESTQSSWALLALAIRIAQGLGMHRDGDGASLDAFHAEMRRRLWWQLVVLDVLLSTDRGSEPLIRENCFTTRRPLHINDADINLQSSSPIHEQSHMVEMTLPLVYMEALHTLKTINLSQVSTESQANRASSFLENLENKYLLKSNSGLDVDPSDTRTWLVHMSGQLLSLMMWLAVQYPLHRRIEESHEFSKHQALRTALALLVMRQRIEEAPQASPFQWWFHMIEPWHALAVALSILCSKMNKDVVKEAWPVVCQAYERCGKRFSGAGHGDVWSPLQSLMAKARSQIAHRSQQVLDLPPEQQQRAAPQPPLDVFETSKSPLRPMNPAWDSNMYFGSHILPWPSDWSTGSSSEEDNTWEDWNKFVDELGYFDQSGNPSMNDAWLMPS